MAKPRILVIEDESDILQLIEYNLLKEGYRVLTAETGEEGVELARSEVPDLILLDIMLPGVDGMDVCKMLRNSPRTKNVLILMLTARSEDIDVVTGLELGADDYITKPFSPRVLMARIKAALRRRDQGRETDDAVPIRIGPLAMDPVRFSVGLNGNPLSLTATEFRTLYFLCRSPGRVYSRKQIVDHTQGEDYAVTERAVDVQIVGIRKKLGTSSTLIETVRGVGYRCKDLR